MKKILLLVGALLMTYVLVSGGEWIIAHSTAYGAIVREHSDVSTGLYFYLQSHEDEIQRDYGADWVDLYIQAGWLAKLALDPVIAVVIGLYVGLFVRQRVKLLTTVCLAPFLCYSLTQPEFYWLGVNLIAAIAYLALALVMAVLTSRWVFHSMSSSSSTSGAVTTTP